MISFHRRYSGQSAFGFNSLWTCSLYTMPTISSIYDKPGAGWNGINTEDYFKNYFKTSDMGDVLQHEKSLQHHNSLKRIIFNWWQWGTLKLFKQIQMKECFLFNVWWINMKRAMSPFEKGIQNCSKMILTYLMQVRNWWCACLLTSSMDWRIKNSLILTRNGWSSWQSIWRKLNQATSNRSDL